MNRLRLVVMISGNGSNLQAIIDAIETGRLQAEICAVISNCPTAYGLTRATQHQLPTAVVDHTQFAQRSDFEQALRETIDRFQPELIVLAGFMRKLTAATVDYYAGRMLNIHPSLLPHYPGLNTHARVLAAGEQHHGVTVHVVTDVVDGGPILGQAALRILADDTPSSLADRVHALEHALYPEVLQQLATGAIGRKAGRIDWNKNNQ